MVLARLLAEDGAATAPAAAALAGGRAGSPAAPAVGSTETLSVETDLDEVLAGVAAPVAVARSAVGLALALVVLLGVTAALLVTRLVQEDRRADAALRASRGFSPGQLRPAHALEALVLVLPAVVLGPLAGLARRCARWPRPPGTVPARRDLGRRLADAGGLGASRRSPGLVVAALLTRRGADGRPAGAGSRRPGAGSGSTWCGARWRSWARCSC